MQHEDGGGVAMPILEVLGKNHTLGPILDII